MKINDKQFIRNKITVALNPSFWCSYFFYKKIHIIIFESETQKTFIEISIFFSFKMLLFLTENYNHF